MRGNDNRGRGDGRREPGRVTRRRVLVGGVAGAVVLAGCSDGGSDEPADAGAGSGDGETESTGEEMGTETADSEGTETDGASADSEGTETDGAAVDRSYREAVQYGGSFEMTGTFEQDGQTAEAEGRFNDGNFYWRFEQDDQVSEIYLVDGDRYVVMDGRCFLNPGRQGSSGAFDPGSFESDSAEAPDVTAEGTTTIDGETMLVYEFASAAASGVESEATYYVNAETGHLRRVEGDFGVLNYHSWGSADPVEAPDMECESY